MCTVVILRRPNHPWPLILAANRDENRGRPWRTPARHWPDRTDVTAGLDVLAGGTWLGVNDYGVVASVLNRPGTLGPAPDKRSRGELPLEALDHAEASAAAEALAHLDPAAYRPFNMLIADAREAFWIAARAGERRVHVAEVGEGLSMLTAHDLNDDAGSARQRHHRPKFTAATPPDPDSRDWESWRMLIESRETAPDGGPDSAMLIEMDDGFATSSSSLIALSKPRPHRQDHEPSIIWRFRGGLPEDTSWTTIGGL
ncbi:NRDE family protein [Magnetovibrio sp.]|uniref:NRDE family protein n=1 Tax=Magnetovibrio sp. TaxID=2024836 RepID=UPI002F94782A